MKRILSLFIIACLCGSLLAGCGETEEPVMTVPLIEQELIVPSESEAEEDVAAPVEPALVIRNPTEGYVSPEERLSPELQEMTKEIIAKAWQAVRQEEWIVETDFSESLILSGADAGMPYYYHAVRVFNTVTGEYRNWSTRSKNDPVFDEQDIDMERYIVLDDGGYITYSRNFDEPGEQRVGYHYVQECENGTWGYANHIGYDPNISFPVSDLRSWQLSLVYTGDIQEVNGYSCYVLSTVVDALGRMGYVYIDTETFLVRLIKYVWPQEAGGWKTSCVTTTYEYENPGCELPSWTKDAILDKEIYATETFEGFFPVDEEHEANLFNYELNSMRVPLGPTSCRLGSSASVIFEDVDGYVERALLADIYIINSENLKFEKKGVGKEFLLAPNQFAVCTIRSDDYTYDLFLDNPSSEPIAIKDCVIFAAAWSGGYVSSVPDEYLPHLNFDLMFGVADNQPISDEVFTSKWESDDYIAWTVSEYPNILVLQDKEGPDLLKIMLECGI